MDAHGITQLQPGSTVGSCWPPSMSYVAPVTAVFVMRWTASRRAPVGDEEPGERRVGFGFRRRLTGTVDGLAGVKQRLRRNDDDVAVAHVGSSVPACSATMYSAYQSGQFGSALPMRFSCLPWAASARRRALARSLACSAPFSELRSSINPVYSGRGADIVMQSCEVQIRIGPTADKLEKTSRRYGIGGMGSLR
jgi:hypothetical protein